MLAEAAADPNANLEWDEDFGPGEILEWFPRGKSLDHAIPAGVRRYLTQAIDATATPDGAVMLAASALDAMLKERKLTKGSLNNRIDEAANKQIITPDVARWAHQIRLDANNPRHADLAAPPHDRASADRVVDFALALADVLFVLPSRVTRGICDAAQAQASDGGVTGSTDRD